MTLSEEHIVGLVPDAATLKSGKELALPSKWTALHKGARALWGLIKGSGAAPYQTVVDTAELAFKCTCPSRKFPCKHGVGLLLAFVRTETTFIPENEEPEWVKNWLDKREEKKRKDAEAAPTAESNEIKAQNKQKNADARLGLMDEGVAHLELFLKDLVRSGLLALPGKEAQFYEKPIAAMVDAKAPGLAAWIKALRDLPFHEGEDYWQNEAMDLIGRAWLHVQAFKNRDALDESSWEDLKSLSGWPTKKSELLESPGSDFQADEWLVLNSSITQEEDLNVYRHWLWGTSSGRAALILDFTHSRAPVQAPTLLVPEKVVKATLCFYPGKIPQRAVLVEQSQTADFHEALLSSQPLPDWDTAQLYYARQISLFPWLESSLMFMDQLRLYMGESPRVLLDSKGNAMAVRREFPDINLYKMLSITGAASCPVFLLRKKNAVVPLGLCWQGQYISI